MMVNCPKCGFSQPQDQYCAKCGVDMVAYRPAEKPFFARLVSNTLVQALFLVLIIGAGFGYIRLQHQADLQARIADLEDSSSTRIIERKNNPSSDPQLASANGSTGETQVHEEASEDEPGAAPQVAAAALSAPSAPQPQMDPGMRSAAAAPNPSTAPVAAAAGSAGDRALATNPTNVRVIFAEVTRAFVSELMGEAPPTSSIQSYAVGMLPNLDARLKRSQGWRALEPETLRSIQKGQPISLIKGIRDEAITQNIGITVNVTPLQSDDPNSTHLAIETRRIFREPTANPPFSDQSFPEEQFQLPKGAGIYQLGVLPHFSRALQDDEAGLYEKVDVLKLLNQDSYRTGSVEFVILIEPR